MSDAVTTKIVNDGCWGCMMVVLAVCGTALAITWMLTR